jgi:7,8-dihydropterin-6-yl-methyl-4-(beta-D-ribofuranosyl)aminobenzene 5'-phosphate synthase
MKNQLQQVDKLEVVVLVDNYSDEMIEDTPVAKRLWAPSPYAVMAEPGLSLLIKVYNGDHSHTVLMDGGISGSCLAHNISLLLKSQAVKEKMVTAEISEVSAVVLSHGHSDHFNGLKTFYEMTQKKIPLIVHPLASVKRRGKVSSGSYEAMVSFDESEFEDLGAIIEKRPQASLTASGSILVSGSIERTNDFEKGSDSLEAEINGKWIVDPFEDDQAIAIYVKNKGLVILGGCSHAGILNSVAYLKKISGVDKVHAILGGFHLPDTASSATQRTLRGIKEIAPEYIIPMHCTGWATTQLFASQMPEQFILNSVGTTYIF